MSIKVLVADDSELMRSAIRRVLQEEPLIEIVGEATSFAQTMQMIGDFKPSVLLIDLHMPERRDFTPAFVKSQLASVGCTLAVSFSNDEEAHALAESYGAVSLLDKMKLYDEMIPAILRCATPKTGLRLRKRSKRRTETTPSTDSGIMTMPDNDKSSQAC
jgi:chemotaxis response regulator CheB